MVKKKLQAPRSKLQRNTKFQIPNSKKTPISKSKAELQVCENLFVGAGEWKSAQFVRAKPVARTFGERPITVRDAVEDVEGDAVAGNGVFDRAELLEGHRKEAEGGFGDFVDGGVAIDFDIWKFPEVCIDDAGWSLTNKEARVSFNNECEETPRSGRCAAGDFRQQMDDAFAIGDAVGFERAIGAARVFGSTNERAEFHEGLVEVGA